MRTRSLTLFKDNYRSVTWHEDDLERQCRADEALGMMYETDEKTARAHFSVDLRRVAGLGARGKGDGTFRVLHDCTHGVAVNHELRQRDQCRMPGVPEERRQQQHMADTPGVHFALKADIKKAHRRFMHVNQD